MLCCSPAATVWCAAWQRGFGVPKAGLVPACSCLWSWMCCSTQVARLRTSPPPILFPTSGPASLRITRATPPPAPPWRPPNVAENGEDPFLYDALLTTLRRIQQHPDPTLVLDAFLLQAMDHAGWAPSLFNCAQCGTPGPHRAFHPEAGGAVCTECRPPGSATPPPEALRMMWWLAHNQWRAVDAAREASISAGDGFFDDVSHHVHQMTRAHVQWHMERKVQALDFVDGGGTIGG